MMTAVLLACVGSFAASEVKEFFPTEQGTSWTYQEVTNSIEIKVTETVVGTAKLPNDNLGTVIRIDVPGQPFGHAIYEVSGNQVLTWAYSDRGFFEKPVPLLTWTTKSANLNFKGVVVLDGQNTPYTMKSTVSSGGITDILGTKAPTLVVTTQSEYKLKDSGTLVNKLTATYAKGFGLVEVNQEGELDGFLMKRTRKLTAFRRGQE